MKTTIANTHSVAKAIAGSSQRGAREYQRKPGYYQLVQRQAAVTVAAPKGPSFREILERELGAASGRAVIPTTPAESETTQFLSGYWA